MEKASSYLNNLKKFENKNIKHLFVILAAIIVLSIIFAIAGNKVLGSEKIMIQGSIKCEETDLNSKIPGLIDQILVEEGQEVKKGDTLIVISSESIEAKKLQAEAAKSAAEAQYSKALNGARSQEVAQAKAAYELAEKTYNRMKTLYEQEAISANTFDQVTAQYKAAKEVYNMAEQGARAEDKAAASALVAQADAASKEVQSYLDDAIIKAPRDGVVTALNVSEGELVSSGLALATITANEKPYVEINVKETELSLIEKGELVNIEIPAYEDEIFEGKIVKIDQKPDFATKRATNNNGDFDVMSYGVKIEFTKANKELYPGMTVMVNISEKSGK